MRRLCEHWPRPTSLVTNLQVMHAGIGSGCKSSTGALPYCRNVVTHYCVKARLRLTIADVTQYVVS